MTVHNDLSAALSARLNCTIPEAREHILFVLNHAKDYQMAHQFQVRTQTVSAFTDYYDVIAYLEDIA